MSKKALLLLAALGSPWLLPGVAAQAPPAAQAHNPLVFADVPDLSMIRVGKAYYLSSTTMHLSPGVPILKSTDLVNWHLVSYAYDTLTSADAMTLAHGQSTYGRGSWASSLRYHQGTYYVSTFAQTTGKTHIYSTKNIEKGPWKVVSFQPSLHDHSLFFDDDGRVYLVYGAGKIQLAELTADVAGLKPGTTPQAIIENASAPAGPSIGLPAEGSQLFKVSNKYYLFNIAWPKGGMRTVVVHRADKLTGPYEGRVALRDLGVAQGGLIDTPDGRWFSYLFRDFGAVGRIPYLVPVQWEAGWPVLGTAGKVPETLALPANKSLIPGLVASDEFGRRAGEPALPLVWQWNHNPDNALWSVAERPGYLRLKTGRVDTTFVQARNTLTQRTIGPVCAGTTALDVAHLQPGDFAGLGVLQKRYGLVGVQVRGGAKVIVMVSAESEKPVEIQRIPLTQNKVHFKIECDFRDRRDVATFFYSLDGQAWQPVGGPLNMAYTLPHFMGYRFSLFNYATERPGGYADFDYFRIADHLNR
ncbi:MAG: glycosyl hydrolase 43 family protein [Cytophagaceae bacterium]|nr:MAG: glycosyl hydrolase 43 family protein [Cytophagaceae bacterium]